MGDDEDEGLRGRVTRSIGWVVAERWGSRLLQLAVFALLARLIEPSAFGVIAMATAITMVLQVMVDSGFAKALVRVEQLEERDASTAFWTSLGIGALTYGALYAAAPLIAQIMGAPELVDVLRVLGLSLPISALSQTPAALLERSFNFRVLSIRQLIAAIVAALAAIPVALLGGGLWALVVQTLSTSVVACIVLWASTSWRPRFAYSRASLRKLWPVGIGIMGIELIDAVQGNIDKIVIGLFFPPDVLGYYYLAQRVGMILMELVTTVMSRVSLTTFAKVQDDLPRLNRIFQQMTFAAGAIGVPVFAVTAIFSPQLIPAIFGPGWEPAIPILCGLAAGWAFGAVMYFDRSALLARGRARAAFGLAVLQNVVGIALLLGLLPLGLVGVVISRWARIFTWPARLWVMHRAMALDVRAYLLQFARIAVAIVPAGVLVIFLQLTPWAQSEWSLFTFAMPMGIVTLASYFSIAWLVAGKENRAALRPLITGLVRRLRRH